jgi:Ca2+-binding EF-hand superfamily protein
MIDANRDGFIDKEDLRATYASLGVRDIDDARLGEMMAEAPAAINFTVFLNMLADKLHGTDPEDVILNAFKLFDPEGKGTIPKQYLGEVLTTQADRFSKEELEQMFEIAPIDVADQLDYKALCYIITHGQEEE